MKKYIFIIPSLILIVFFLYAYKQPQSEQNELGDIRYSIIKPEVFERLNPGWKLMGGQAMEQNWDLYQLFQQENLLNDPLYASLKNNLPEGRGEFLRGMNYQIGDNQGKDPQSNRLIGSQQNDDVKKHTHDVSFLGRKGDIVGFQNTAGQPDAVQRITWAERIPYGSAKTDIIIEENEGVESRPINTTVYIYIKINN